MSGTFELASWEPAPDDDMRVRAPAATRRVSALGPVTGDDAIPVHPTMLGHAAEAV